MKPPAHPVRLSVLASAILALAACGGGDGGTDGADDAGGAAAEAERATRGTYAIDAATGETSAEYTAADGTTTTMRSGGLVPVELPAGFSLYPGARVVNNTRVEQADGLLVLLDLEGEAAAEDMVAFYRKQAEAAGVDIAMSLQSGATIMIGGEGADGTSFSFTATREDRLTEAQLSVGRGLE